ncbi:MAG: N-formylglutamate amidohydrolase [Pseudomonadota bacterium]
MVDSLQVAPRVADGDFAPRVENPNGPHAALLVCEHASARMPASFDGLGLRKEDLDSHIAWDPGALETARHLSTILDATIVHSTVSRLIYDCNRPPDADSAMPARSEETAVPGNTGLTVEEKAERTRQFYRPFEALLSDTLSSRSDQSVLVTIHSFTPIFRGQKRSVEIGILHDDDSRLADALLQVAGGFRIERNAPYGPEDGVTHTLRQHAMPRGILNVMFEIRNDLIASSEQCESMAQTLAGWLTKAIAICAEEGRG